MHQAPAVAHIGDRRVEQSSSDSARGRDEELEESEEKQEANSGETATIDNPMEGMIGVAE